MVTRSSNFRSAIALLVILTTAALTSLVGDPAGASPAPSESVQVLMPFDGKWGNAGAPSTHPAVHHKFQLDFAMDIYAVGAPVRANFANATGKLVLRLQETPRKGGCGAAPGADIGFVVLVDAFVDDEFVGHAQYLHLKSIDPAIRNLSAGAEIPNGQILGTLPATTAENFPFTSGCWEVNNQAGYHVHFGLFNPSQSGWACFVAHGSLGTDITTDDTLGVLGGNGQSWVTGERQECPAAALNAGDGGVLPVTDRKPSAPTDVVATPGDGLVNFKWEPPTDKGQPEVSIYQVELHPDGDVVCRNPSSSRTCRADGLTNGQSYTFDVWAINDVGGSKTTVTVSPVEPNRKPSAPRDVVAIAGNGEVAVEWSPPEDGGRPPATRYIARAAPGDNKCETTVDRNSCVILGLTNGTEYTISVVAQNSVGNSKSGTANATPFQPDHKVVVRAKGDQGGETFDVKIGDEVIGSGTAHVDYEDFTFTAKPTLGGTVSVVFTNDFYDGKDYDRNLWVDRVTVNGTMYESEATSTYSEGTWSEGSGCSPGFRQNELIACGNGSISVIKLGEGSAAQPAEDPYLPEEPASDEVAPKHVIRVRAKGHTGGERFALRIGSTIIDHVTVTNEWRTYRFKLDELPSGSLVVGFMNDSDDGYNDFNLQVDFVRIDDRKIETEAATTYMAGPGNGDACVSGHRNAETLYCAGAFFYADL